MRLVYPKFNALWKKLSKCVDLVPNLTYFNFFFFKVLNFSKCVATGHLKLNKATVASLYWNTKYDGTHYFKWAGLWYWNWKGVIMLKLWMAETVLSLTVNLTRNLRDFFVLNPTINQRMSWNNKLHLIKKDFYSPILRSIIWLYISSIISLFTRIASHNL